MSITSEMFDRINRGIGNVKERKTRQLDDAIKIAQLQGAGYQLTPQGITRDSSFLTNAEIERQLNIGKLQELIDPTISAKRDVQKAQFIMSSLNNGEEMQKETQSPTFDFDALQKETDDALSKTEGNPQAQMEIMKRYAETIKNYGVKNG